MDDDILWFGKWNWSLLLCCWMKRMKRWIRVNRWVGLRCLRIGDTNMITRPLVSNHTRWWTYTITPPERRYKIVFSIKSFWSTPEPFYSQLAWGCLIFLGPLGLAGFPLMMSTENSLRDGYKSRTKGGLCRYGQGLRLKGKRWSFLNSEWIGWQTSMLVFDLLSRVWEGEECVIWLDGLAVSFRCECGCMWSCKKYEW